MAYAVLRDYRARTGDETPAAVVSTASPYKFCQAVLDALGENGAVSGLEAVERLSERTGTRAPRPLTELKDKAVRFTRVAEKSAMRGVVLDFLQ